MVPLIINSLKLTKMKSIINRSTLSRLVFVSFSIVVMSSTFAQGDSAAPIAEAPHVLKVKPVKNTFESGWLIDNQSVMVPVKKTFEMDIQHRFGTVEKGYSDFFGFFAPSNIRLGFSYAPVNKLNLGLGITKGNMLWDASAKYSLLKQTKGIYPVSITYFGSVAFDTRKDGQNGAFSALFSKSKITNGDGIFTYSTDRFLFFNQLIIARKITDKFSIQVAPSVSHQNSVNGYYKQVDSATRIIAGEMKNNHIAVAVGARYKLTNVTSVIVNYDQPITKHATNNPNPNVSFGLEFSTGSHAFQVFAGNYSLLNQARNNLYNHNNYKDGKFLIGFNITRLWNY
jgi:hypothetical protein